MKRTKSLLLTSLVVVLVAAFSLYAGGDKAEKLAKMKAEYNLTDAQVTQLDQKFAQLDPIAERAKAIKSELKALESAEKPDQKAIDAKKAELSAVKKEHKAKVTSIFRSVLTREQFAKWEAQQAEYEKAHSAKK